MRWPDSPGRDSRSNPVFDINWPYRDQDIMNAFAAATSTPMIDTNVLPEALAAKRSRLRQRKAVLAQASSWLTYSATERSVLRRARLQWPVNIGNLASWANSDVLEAEWHARFGDSPIAHPGAASLVWCEANLVAVAHIIGQQIQGCRAWDTSLLDTHRVRVDVDEAIREVTVRAYRMWRAHADTYLSIGMTDEQRWCEAVDLVDRLADYRRRLMGRVDLLLAYRQILDLEDTIDDVAIALEFGTDPHQPVDRPQLRDEVDRELGDQMHAVAAALGEPRSLLPLQNS